MENTYSKLADTVNCSLAQAVMWAAYQRREGAMSTCVNLRALTGFVADVTNVR